MAIKTIAHRGYHGTIEVNTDDFSLHGKVLFVDEDITYQGESFAELEQDFQAGVEKHLRSCREAGLEPPFQEKK